MRLTPLHPRSVILASMLAFAVLLALLVAPEAATIDLSLGSPSPDAAPVAAPDTAAAGEATWATDPLRSPLETLAGR